MSAARPDQMILQDDWSDLRQFRDMPEIDQNRMHRYRIGRIKAELREAGAAMCVLVSPMSLRYAVDCQAYALFQSHHPSSYLFVPVEGPVVIHDVYGAAPLADELRSGRPLCYFDGGSELAGAARLLADDIVNFLSEIGTDIRRVAIEYVNPSITQALERRGLDVIDGMVIAEHARVVKSADELKCMRWSIAVAEHSLYKMQQAIQPGVTELQLWGLINYTNLANNGAWHDGRMLASGPRTNPWLQEATQRKVQAGDLVGVDTDMIGPFGYCADISRTFFCGPGKPSARQKELYALAVEEIQFNLQFMRPGMTLSEFQNKAYLPPEEFHAHAYPCLIHGVGMCDEWPRVDPIFSGPVFYDAVLQPGMVICVESFVGAVGESDGVKLEEQILITDSGYELLSTFPLDEDLMA